MVTFQERQTKNKQTQTTDDDGRRTTDDDDDDDDDGKISKNIFKLCHHIDFNTTTPNPILKNTISFTQTPTTKTLSIFLIFFWNNSKMQNLQKLNFLFGIMYTFHSSQFL